MDFKKIPKVELHLHLDGSVRIDTVSELTNKSKEAVAKEMVASSRCEDLNDYLTKFDLPISIMQTKENLERVSKELALDLVADGVIYAEIRFAPIFHLKKGLSLEEVVESVLKGLREVPLKTNLILCLMRNSPLEENKMIIDLAYKYLNKGVCAIDLAGAEALYKTLNFKDLFAYATSLGIPFTIHAGEADGVDSINAAIDFGAKRIGHGVRCVEDEATIKRIIDNNITLEVCPTSNLQTNIIDEYDKHPIKYLFNKGISVTINTDNRTVSNVTLSEEYEKLSKAFGFTENYFKLMNYEAITAAFISDEEKELLFKKYN